MFMSMANQKITKNDHGVVIDHAFNKVIESSDYKDKVTRKNIEELVTEMNLGCAQTNPKLFEATVKVFFEQYDHDGDKQTMDREEFMRVFSNKAKKADVKEFKDVDVKEQHAQL